MDFFVTTSCAVLALGVAFLKYRLQAAVSVKRIHYTANSYRFVFWENRDVQLRVEGRELVLPQLYILRTENTGSAAITAALHANRDTKWRVNHLRDIDAMSCAVPYCQIVVTDQQVARLLARTPAVQRLGTLVLDNLAELNERLPDLVAAHAVGDKQRA